MSAPARMAVSAIVLAGGRSSRFGRDKLAEPLHGRPILEHVVEAVATLATDIVLVRATDAATRAGSPAAHAGPVAVRTVRDPEPFGGPLIGVLAGLEAAREPTALVVGGDMPRLEPTVLRLLVRALASTEPVDVDAVIVEGRGRTQPLPIAVRTGAGTVAAQRALGHGARSLLAWLDALRVRALPEQEWRALDPEGATLVDVDVPGDLDRLRGR